MSERKANRGDNAKSIKTVLHGLKRAKDRVTYLRENNSSQLRKLLKANFDSRIVFSVPAGLPNIDQREDLEKTLTLEEVADQLYLIIKGATNLSSLERERQFMDWYERMEPKEASILLAIKDKKLQEKLSYITLELVREAFPETVIK